MTAALLTRAELLELLPEAWPGLSKCLDALERKSEDPVTVRTVRRLLASAAVEIRTRDDDEKRAALLDFLGGAVVSRAAHEERVRELIYANNREVERGRAAREFVRFVATMTSVECDCDDMASELKKQAAAIINGWGGSRTFRPKYGANERDRAASILSTAARNGHSPEELVDMVATALGLDMA